MVQSDTIFPVYMDLFNVMLVYSGRSSHLNVRQNVRKLCQVTLICSQNTVIQAVLFSATSESGKWCNLFMHGATLLSPCCYSWTVIQPLHFGWTSSLTLLTCVFSGRTCALVFTRQNKYSKLWLKVNWVIQTSVILPWEDNLSKHDILYCIIGFLECVHRPSVM